MKKIILTSLFSLIAVSRLLASVTVVAADKPLLNVSYDPSREFYQEYKRSFADFCQKHKKTIL